MFDAIVVGLGGMGSAAAYHLAKRGQRVLGLDRFAPPHDRGSSHGDSRIIRLAYYEHPSYVPLLRHSYELWRTLEREAGAPLLRITGSLDISPRDGRIFTQSLASCEQHSLPHEMLDRAALSKRFPAYRLPSDFMAVLQPEGGVLNPERCVSAHIAGAKAAGADIHMNERVVSVSLVGSDVLVATDRSRYIAPMVVVTAGSWASELVPRLRGLAQPERQVVAWFSPSDPSPFAPERFPVFNIEVDEGHYYGFPFDGSGVKIGRYHHLGEQVHPDGYDQRIHPNDEAPLRTFMTRYMPGAAGHVTKAQTCLFTNSPDEHFIIDRGDTGLVLAAGFSGHGFKFCCVVGAILADLAIDGSTRHDISLFSLSRF